MNPRTSAEQAKFRREVYLANKRNDESGRIYMICGGCNGKIDPACEPWTADHTIPREFGGTTGKPLCKHCDKEKTYKKDLPAIAKSKRASDKHLGIRRKGWGGKYRKKMSGEVVER